MKRPTKDGLTTVTFKVTMDSYYLWKLHQIVKREKKEWRKNFTVNDLVRRLLEEYGKGAYVSHT